MRFSKAIIQNFAEQCAKPWQIADLIAKSVKTVQGSAVMGGETALKMAKKGVLEAATG